MSEEKSVKPVLWVSSSKRDLDAIVVLHAFQKKSKRGIGTPKQEIELVRSRLKLAEGVYEDWKRKGSKSNG